MDWIAYYSSKEGQALYQDVILAKGNILKITCTPKERLFLPFLVTLYQLREHGTDKIPMAHDMLMTRRGYEQATDYWIARWKGSLLHSGSRILIGCGGIGMELLTVLESAASVDVVDLDAEMCAIAQYNVEQLFPEHAHKVTYHTQDLLEFLTNVAVPYDYILVDPDRREGDSRRISIDQYSPAVPQLMELLPKASKQWMIKLSPMVPMEELHGLEGNLLFIEGDGSLKEIVVTSLLQQWSMVSVVEKNVYIFDRPRVIGAPVFLGALSELGGKYLMIPTAAMRRAGYVDTLANVIGAQKTQYATSLLLTDQLPTKEQSIWLESYHILDAHPFHKKNIKSLLKQRGISKAVVKKRDFPMEPEEILRMCKIKQGGTHIFFFTTLGEDLVMLEVERVIFQ